MSSKRAIALTRRLSTRTKPRFSEPTRVHHAQSRKRAHARGIPMMNLNNLDYCAGRPIARCKRWNRIRLDGSNGGNQNARYVIGTIVSFRTPDAVPVPMSCGALCLPLRAGHLVPRLPHNGCSPPLQSRRWRRRPPNQ